MHTEDVPWWASVQNAGCETALQGSKSQNQVALVSRNRFPRGQPSCDDRASWTRKPCLEPLEIPPTLRKQFANSLKNTLEWASWTEN